MTQTRNITLAGGLALGMFIPAVTVSALDISAGGGSSAGIGISTGMVKVGTAAQAGLTIEAGAMALGQTAAKEDEKEMTAKDRAAASGAAGIDITLRNDPVITADGAIVGRVAGTRNTADGGERIVIDLLGQAALDARRISVMAASGSSVDGRFRLGMTRADLMAAVDAGTRARAGADSPPKSAPQMPTDADDADRM